MEFNMVVSNIMLKQFSGYMLFFSAFIFVNCAAKNNVCDEYIHYTGIDWDWNQVNCWNNPDYGSELMDIIKNNDYEGETHEVITEDGYILTLIRVRPRDYGNRRNKGVVFLQHGILTDSSCFLIFGSRSLAYQLVNYGYDVWLGNSRGTRLSRKHLNSTIKDSDYWSFSFHEMGIYDLPAALNRIGEVIGSTKRINYVGHSMGTTQSFIYASMHAAHATVTLKQIVAVAPVAYFTGSSIFLQLAASIRSLIQGVLQLFNIFNIDLAVMRFLSVLRPFCRYFPDIYLCIQLAFFFIGDDPSRLPPRDAPLIFANYLSSTSVQSLVHYGQFVGVEPKFHPFDYDPATNQLLYNLTSPPAYKLHEIELPVRLFYAMDDTLATPQDVSILHDSLTNTPERSMLRIPTDAALKPYGHVDFLMANDVEHEFLPHLLKVLD